MITVAMISTAMTMTIAQEVPHFCHHVVFLTAIAQEVLRTKESGGSSTEKETWCHRRGSDVNVIMIVILILVSMFVIMIVITIMITISVVSSPSS